MTCFATDLTLLALTPSDCRPLLTTLAAGTRVQKARAMVLTMVLTMDVTMEVTMVVTMLAHSLCPKTAPCKRSHCRNSPRCCSTLAT